MAERSIDAEHTGARRAGAGTRRRLLARSAEPATSERNADVQALLGALARGAGARDRLRVGRGLGGRGRPSGDARGGRPHAAAARRRLRAPRTARGRDRPRHARPRCGPAPLHARERARRRGADPGRPAGLRGAPPRRRRRRARLGAAAHAGGARRGGRAPRGPARLRRVARAARAARRRGAAPRPARVARRARRRDRARDPEPAGVGEDVPPAPARARVRARVLASASASSRRASCAASSASSTSCSRTRARSRRRATATAPPLAAACESVVQLVSHRAADLGIAVQVTPGDAALRVALSDDALRQVVLNLLLNALDATPRGGAVRVVLHRRRRGRRAPHRGRRPGHPRSAPRAHLRGLLLLEARRAGRPRPRHHARASSRTPAARSPPRTASPEAAASASASRFKNKDGPFFKNSLRVGEFLKEKDRPFLDLREPLLGEAGELGEARREEVVGLGEDLEAGLRDVARARGRARPAGAR